MCAIVWVCLFSRPFFVLMDSYEGMLIAPELSCRSVSACPPVPVASVCFLKPVLCVCVSPRWITWRVCCRTCPLPQTPPLERMMSQEERRGRKRRRWMRTTRQREISYPSMPAGLRYWAKGRSIKQGKCMDCMYVVLQISCFDQLNKLLLSTHNLQRQLHLGLDSIGARRHPHSFDGVRGGTA